MVQSKNNQTVPAPPLPDDSFISFLKSDLNHIQICLYSWEDFSDGGCVFRLKSGEELFPPGGYHFSALSERSAKTKCPVMISIDFSGFRRRGVTFFGYLREEILFKFFLRRWAAISRFLTEGECKMTETRYSFSRKFLDFSLKEPKKSHIS